MSCLVFTLNKLILIKFNNNTFYYNIIKIMDEFQQEMLQKMIKENNTENNTEKIRTLKHSSKIRKDVSNIANIKRKNRNRDFKTLDRECQSKAGFLFRHYPIIYNKMIKNEINMKIMYRFLDVLSTIENGEKDQHEASYEIGMLLKQLYIDKKIDLSKEKTRQDKNIKPKKLSYEEYKKMMAEKEKTEN